MMKKIYLSHPYQGREENREKAAALAAFYRAVWDAEGKFDWVLVDPLSYFEPLERDGVDDETILAMAVALMNDCDGVLFAPGWKHSRGCRYEHWKLRHSHKDNKYFKAEIPAEVEEAATYWFGKHHVTVRRLAA